MSTKSIVSVIALLLFLTVIITTASVSSPSANFGEGKKEFIKLDMSPGDQPITVTTAMYPGYSRITEKIDFKNEPLERSGKLKVEYYRIEGEKRIYMETEIIEFPKGAIKQFSSRNNDRKFQLVITCIEASSFSLEKERTENIPR